MKWKLLSEDQRLGIRNFLVDMLIKNVTDDNTFAANSHLINKLNYVIVLVKIFFLFRSLIMNGLPPGPHSFQKFVTQVNPTRISVKII